MLLRELTTVFNIGKLYCVASPQKRHESKGFSSKNRDENSIRPVCEQVLEFGEGPVAFWV